MNSKYKIINIVLILVMLSHASFLHEYLQNYIICYEPNGDVQIENINDCDECTNLNITIPVPITNQSSIDKTDCIDFPLEGDYINHHQFIPNSSKVQLTKNILFSEPIFIRSEQKKYYTNLKTTCNNLILEHYTSVSLII